MTCSPSVLVLLDDDELTHELVRRKFRNTPIELRCFLDVDVAMQDIHANCPMALLVDYYMPRLDGLEFVAALESQRPELICLWSAIPLSDPATTEADRLGVKTFLKDDLDKLRDEVVRLGVRRGCEFSGH